MSATTAPPKDGFSRNERALSVRQQNTNAAKAVAETIRTSLGPLGMDKLIQGAKGDVMITNDGATILQQMNVTQPAAEMLVELSKAQDVEAGDGTTSVVVVCGSLMEAAAQLLEKGLHPQTIASGFLKGAAMAQEVIEEMAIDVDVTDREQLERAVTTSLASKVVSSLASHLAPIAVDAVCAINPEKKKNVDLRDIRVVEQLGGTIEDSELVRGLVLPNQRISRVANGPVRCEKAKIGLIQFCLSLPKTDMDQQVTIRDYSAMDRLLRQERLHMAKLVKHIQATGCNVLLIQKSILREAVTPLALDFLAKANIVVVRDIERDDVDFISRTLGCEPVASLDHFTSSKLGSAALVEEVRGGDSGCILKFLGTPANNTISVVIRASNSLTLHEAVRSFHDAICVVRSIFRTGKLLSGGGAPEMHISTQLANRALSLGGTLTLVVTEFARAFEVIPRTLAENAGLRPIEVTTELRNKHSRGLQHAGIDVKKGSTCDNIIEQLNIVQPALVTKSVVSLATETVMLILRIDDVVLCR